MKKTFEGSTFIGFLIFIFVITGIDTISTIRMNKDNYHNNNVVVAEK